MFRRLQGNLLRLLPAVIPVKPFFRSKIRGLPLGRLPAMRWRYRDRSTTGRLAPVRRTFQRYGLARTLSTLSRRNRNVPVLSEIEMSPLVLVPDPYRGTVSVVAVENCSVVFQGAVGAFLASTAPAASTGSRSLIPAYQRRDTLLDVHVVPFRGRRACGRSRCPARNDVCPKYRRSVPKGSAAGSVMLAHVVPRSGPGMAALRGAVARLPVLPAAEPVEQHADENEPPRELSRCQSLPSSLLARS